MKAVVIGPGRVGCGLVGQLLRESGWELTFVGRGPAIEKLARDGRYTVRLVEGATHRDVVVEGFAAIRCDDAEAVTEAIGRADLVATAVGVPNLAAVAPLIASGLGHRCRPTNVVAFENLLRAGSHLRGQVAAHLPPGFPLHRHGFSGAVVNRVVSRREWPAQRRAPLMFVADHPSTFWVDCDALRAPLTALVGAVATSQYEAEVQRKLYTYSAGHAACAYLGFLKGYHYIHTAIRDPEIRSAVRAAMAEGQRGLAARYGQALAGGPTDLDAILARFANAGLADPIARVGRDPRRKLGTDDRLVGAARLAVAGGMAPQTLALAVAAALVFCDPDDPCCLSLHHEVEERGLPEVLRAVCGLGVDDEMSRLVSGEFVALYAGWAPGNLLLSIESRSWAWSAGGAPGPAAELGMPPAALQPA